MKHVTIDARLINSAGIGTYLKNLIPRLIDSLHDCHFNLLGERSLIEKFLNNHGNKINIINFDSPIYSIQEQLKLPLLTPKKTDLFWAPHFNFPILNSGKIIVTVHDVFHLAMKEFIPNRLKQFYPKIMFSLLPKRASRIVCDSHFTAQELIKYTGINEDQIEVIHIGVHKNFFDGASNSSPYEFPYLLYIGNVKPHKNISRLIQAFQKLKKEFPHHLVIVGKKEGFLSEDEIIKAMSTGEKERIIFTGQIDDAKVKELYSHADALVFPSLYEGFGLPPLEAMARQCPAIISNIPPLREMCGDAAIYFNPRDVDDIYQKIKMVLSSSDLREEIKQKGVPQAKKFDWQITGDRMSTIFKELLA